MARLSGSSLILGAYRVTGHILRPVLDVLIARRIRRGKEDPRRRDERYGMASIARPDGPLVWVHAASVGETLSAMPVIQEIVGRDISVLLTTGTVTSAKIASDQLPDGAFHQYVPLDVEPYVRRFLDTWKPDLAMFVESEIWPLTLSELGERSVPVVTVNGRMSPRSANHWKRIKRFSDQVFSNIDLCLAQSEHDAAMFAQLGVVRARATGNLKFDRDPPPCDQAALESLRESVGDRRVWIAASTHPGEEDLALSAHQFVLARNSRSLLIIAPRHPERGTEIADAAREKGYSIAVRSRGEIPDEKTQVYVADTIGDLGLLYRLSELAFVGGSFADRGGQNPVEPAQLGIPVIHGPRVRNFKSIYKDLNDAGGAVRCRSEGEFGAGVADLLFDNDKREILAGNARGYVGSQRGALKRTIKALTPFLETLSSRPDQQRETA